MHPGSVVTHRVLTRRRPGRTLGRVGYATEPIDRIEIEVFVVEDDAATDHANHPTVADHVRRGYELVRDHARDVHAAPGYRVGAVPAISGTRRGGSCDIVRSLRVDPWTASAIAGSRAFRHHPHRFLTFLEADPGDDRVLTWTVLVATPRLRAVPATLHLRAAPSMVLSVLELVPRRRLRWRRTAFIDAGVAAIESLARELEHDVQVVSDTT